MGRNTSKRTRQSLKALHTRPPQAHDRDDGLEQAKAAWQSYGLIATGPRVEAVRHSHDIWNSVARLVGEHEGTPPRSV